MCRNSTGNIVRVCHRMLKRSRTTGRHISSWLGRLHVAMMSTVVGQERLWHLWRRTSGRGDCPSLWDLGCSYRSQARAQWARAAWGTESRQQAPVPQGPRPEPAEAHLWQDLATEKARLRGTKETLFNSQKWERLPNRFLHLTWKCNNSW